MRIDHSQDKRLRRAEPSLWICEPANDAVSPLENALRGDVREKNAQLRKLAVQLSNLLGDLPVTTTSDAQSGGTKASD